MSKPQIEGAKGEPILLCLVNAYRTSSVLARNLSGYPTNQDLARCCQGRLLLVSGFIDIYDQGEFILPRWPQ